MPDELSGDALERCFELIAEAIDRVGPERERMFLAKLCLVLSRDAGNVERVAEAIRIAERDISPAGDGQP